MEVFFLQSENTIKNELNKKLKLECYWTENVHQVCWRNQAKINKQEVMM